MYDEVKNKTESKLEMCGMEILIRFFKWEKL